MEKTFNELAQDVREDIFLGEAMWERNMRNRHIEEPQARGFTTQQANPTTVFIPVWDRPLW